MDKNTQAGDGQNPGFLWTKSEKKKIRGPRKWTSKINYIYVCVMKKMQKKNPKTLDAEFNI